MEGKLNLKHEQEVLSNLADMMNDMFMLESTYLRVARLETVSTAVPKEVYKAILDVFAYDAVNRFRKNGIDALASFVDGDLLSTLVGGIEAYTQYQPVNVKLLRRKIADYLISSNGYTL